MHCYTKKQFSYVTKKKIKWINIEIEIAKSYGKPKIGIEPWASEKTSKVVKDNADKIVKWQGTSIVAAIKELG